MCAPGRGGPARSVRLRGSIGPGARRGPARPAATCSHRRSPNRLGTRVLCETTGIPPPCPQGTGMGAPLACGPPPPPRRHRGKFSLPGVRRPGESRRRPPPRGCSVERGPTAPSGSRCRGRRPSPPPAAPREGKLLPVAVGGARARGAPVPVPGGIPLVSREAPTEAGDPPVGTGGGRGGSSRRLPALVVPREYRGGCTEIRSID